MSLQDWTFTKEAGDKIRLIDLKRSLFEFRKAANVLLYAYDKAANGPDSLAMGDAFATSYPRGWESFDDVVDAIDGWVIDATKEVDKLINQ
jgi:hypothetical protein